MRSPRIQRAATWLCLLAYLLAGTVGPSRLVLCLEPCGDVALEIQASGGDCSGCRADTAAAEGHDATPVADAVRCGCIDIPLLMDRDDNVPQAKAENGDRTGPVLARLATPSAEIVTAEPAWPRPRSSEPAPPDRGERVLTHLRTVVLLI